MKFYYWVFFNVSYRGSWIKVSVIFLKKEVEILYFFLSVWKLSFRKCKEERFSILVREFYFKFKLVRNRVNDGC